MSGQVEQRYLVIEEGNRMIFRTPDFRAEGISVLHSGIYNRELASMLASMILAGALSLFFFVEGKRTLFHYSLIVIALVGSFPLFRTYIFPERELEAIFNPDTSRCEIYVSGFRKRRIQSLEMGSIRQVLVEKKSRQVDNPDAVEFVERISAQHGASIPHFEEEITNYLLILKRSQGDDILLFSSAQMEQAVSAQTRLREYLEAHGMPERAA